MRDILSVLHLTVVYLSKLSLAGAFESLFLRSIWLDCLPRVNRAMVPQPAALGSGWGGDDGKNVEFWNVWNLNSGDLCDEDYEVYRVLPHLCFWLFVYHWRRGGPLVPLLPQLSCGLWTWGLLQFSSQPWEIFVISDVFSYLSGNFTLERY